MLQGSRKSIENIEFLMKTESRWSHLGVVRLRIGKEHVSHTERERITNTSVTDAKTKHEAVSCRFVRSPQGCCKTMRV